eukprot:2621294-Prymnesium_polylepis.2
MRGAQALACSASIHARLASRPMPLVPSSTTRSTRVGPMSRFFTTTADAGPTRFSSYALNAPSTSRAPPLALASAAAKTSRSAS